MTDGCRWQGAALVVAAALLAGTPGAALARGTFKGTFGDVRFKAKKLAVACGYVRSLGFFTVTGTQSKQRGRLQSGASTAGYGADPSAPGTVFPIVLTDAVASFLHGAGASPPVWTGSTALGNEVVITLTGYKRGKVTGTLSATLSPSLFGADTPIQVNASFAGKCTIQ